MGGGGDAPVHRGVAVGGLGLGVGPELGVLLVERGLLGGEEGVLGGAEPLPQGVFVAAAQADAAEIQRFLTTLAAGVQRSLSDNGREPSGPEER
jgi:hypothetical protein